MLIYAIILIVMMIISWNPASRAFMEKHRLGGHLFKKKNTAGKEGE
jgi:hypothetical protein